MAVAKKKQQKGISPKESAKLAEEARVLFERDSKARHDQAHRLYAVQDEDTQEAIDKLVSYLVKIARTEMWLRVGGGTERVIITLPETAIRHNAFYMAVEIVKDLAQMDVRVAGFKFDSKMCGVCHAEIKNTKKPKVVKKKR